MMDQIRGINQSPPGWNQQEDGPWMCIVQSWCHHRDWSDQLPLLRSPEMGVTFRGSANTVPRFRSTKTSLF